MTIKVTGTEVKEEGAAPKKVDGILSGEADRQTRTNNTAVLYPLDGFKAGVIFTNHSDGMTAEREGVTSGTVSLVLDGNPYQEGERIGTGQTLVASVEGGGRLEALWILAVSLPPLARR